MVLCFHERYYECSKFLYCTSLCLFMFGFLAWNLDNNFCSHLRYAYWRSMRMMGSLAQLLLSRFCRQARHSVSRVVRPVTQLHAWWHILAGLGTYLALMFCLQARGQYLKRSVTLVACCQGWCPLFVRVHFDRSPCIRSCTEPCSLPSGLTHCCSSVTVETAKSAFVVVQRLTMLAFGTSDMLCVWVYFGFLSLRLTNFIMSLLVC